MLFLSSGHKGGHGCNFRQTPPRVHPKMNQRSGFHGFQCWHSSRSPFTLLTRGAIWKSHLPGKNGPEADRGLAARKDAAPPEGRPRAWEFSRPLGLALGGATFSRAAGFRLENGPFLEWARQPRHWRTWRTWRTLRETFLPRSIHSPVAGARFGNRTSQTDTNLKRTGGLRRGKMPHPRKGGPTHGCFPAPWAWLWEVRLPVAPQVSGLRMVRFWDGQGVPAELRGRREDGARPRVQRASLQRLRPWRGSGGLRGRGQRERGLGGWRGCRPCRCRRRWRRGRGFSRPGRRRCFRCGQAASALRFVLYFLLLQERWRPCYIGTSAGGRRKKDVAGRTVWACGREGEEESMGHDEEIDERYGEMSKTSS